jgi:hypothetical protein
VVTGLLTLLLTLAGLGCGDRGRPGSTPPTPSTPAPQQSLRLIAITDLSGYLEPCGCQSRPLGGIDRALAQLAALKADGVPSLFVSAGDLLFEAGHQAPGGHGPAEAQAVQDAWKAETLVQILNSAELTAATPGPADLAHLAGYGPLLAAARFELLGGAALGAAAGGAPANTRIVERGGRKLGLWGLSAAGLEAEVAAAELPAQARAATAKLRAEGAQWVLGLLSAEPRLARRIAGGTPGLDFVLSGGRQQAEPTPPEQVGGALLLTAGRQGHGLLVVDLFGAAGPFADRSAWSRTRAAAALQANIVELEARIAEWQREPGVQKADLDAQRARLGQMQRDLAATARVPAPTGPYFEARFIELDEDAPAQPETTALIDAYDQRVNGHNKTALAERTAPPVQAGQPAYAGSALCGTCHEHALSWWQKHPHGLAYATLEKMHKQYNLSCVGCHVTGYEKPGGSAVVKNAGLTNVGCESCHGPGSLHAADPDADLAEMQTVKLEVAETVCVECHNEEHSDAFDYEKYKAKLMAPGHGKPVL